MADLPDGFDLEALLAPIPGDAPQGIDIREDFSATSPYNRLRDARSEARDAERGQDAGGENTRDPTPLWRSVRELALKTLAETTKDLEVAAWLTEALVRSHGLAGLAAGAQLMAGLAEQYWDGLFPLPDDYGMETRVAPVTGLNGRDGNGSLIQPLHKMALFNRPDGAPVAFYQYQQSRAAWHARCRTAAAAHRRGCHAAGRPGTRGARGGQRVSSRRCWPMREAARDAWQAMAARARREGRRRRSVDHGGARPADRASSRSPAATRRAEAAGGDEADDAAARRRRAVGGGAAGGGGFAGIAVGAGSGGIARGCAARAGARSPTSSAAPNRTRRSPTRWTRRCAAAA